MQKEVSRSFEHFALVDVLFHVVLRHAYVIQFLVHKLDHMEMVEHVDCVGAIFTYGGNESGRKVCGNILDLNTSLLQLLPEAIQDIKALSLAHIENASLFKSTTIVLYTRPLLTANLSISIESTPSNTGGA